MEAFLLGAAFVVGAMVLGFVPAQLLRRRFGATQPADTRSLASDVMARIGVLHGLILALAFNSASGGLQQLRNDVNAEAAAVDHIYFNARRYGAPEVQRASLAYIDAVMKRDWPSLEHQGRLSGEGWRAWAGMLDGALALEPKTPRETRISDQIQNDVWRIEKLRQARGYESDNRLPGEFWLLAVAGLVLIASLLFVHEIKPLHQAIMAMYSAYTGLALFLIYDLSHPFTGALRIGPDAFRVTLQSIQAGI